MPNSAHAILHDSNNTPSKYTEDRCTKSILGPRRAALKVAGRKVAFESKYMHLEFLPRGSGGRVAFPSYSYLSLRKPPARSNGSRAQTLLTHGYTTGLFSCLKRSNCKLLLHITSKLFRRRNDTRCQATGLRRTGSFLPVRARDPMLCPRPFRTSQEAHLRLARSKKSAKAASAPAQTSFPRDVKKKKSFLKRVGCEDNGF